jgi:ADP-ribose pyrophosphatase
MASKLVEKQLLYNGKKVRLELHHIEEEETETRHVREIVVHPGAVVIIPFVTADEILLIRTYRYAAGQYLMELPAGTLEKNEDPINCAGRELAEETGYTAGRLKSIGNFFTSPGILTEKMYAYAAYDLVKGEQNLDEGEDIEVEQVTLDEAIGMIGDGQIHDGKTIAALLMYDKFFRGQ